MEEVTTLGPEGAKEIIKRWEPFNRGKSMAAHLEQLYPAMLRMPVEVQAEGKGEKYIVSIPAYACKEDLKQAVEDGMLIHNRNFVQLVELVCSQLLRTTIISSPSHYFIQMCYFAGGHGHPKHDLPAPIVLDSVEGCKEVTALRPIGRF